MKYIILFAAAILLSMHVYTKQKRLIGYTPYMKIGADYLYSDTLVTDTAQYKAQNKFFARQSKLGRGGFSKTFKIF